MTTETTLRGAPAITWARQVDEQFSITVVHDGSHWHRHNEVFTPRPVLTLRGPVLSVGGSAKWVVAESQEGRLIMVGYQPDVATTSTVTTIRTALCDVRLSAKTDTTRPPVAGFGMELGGIYEGGHTTILGGSP